MENKRRPTASSYYDETYSARDLRSALSQVRVQMSRARRMAIIAPLILALLAWFVVPSYAASYQFANGGARVNGISESSTGLGPFEIWDGSGWQTAGSSSYRLLGNWVLQGSDGTQVPAFCIQLQNQHYSTDVLTPIAEDVHPQIGYIINHFAPVASHAGQLTLNDESAAVQLAVWSYTNDSLNPAPYHSKGWLPVPGIPGAIVARAQAMVAEANAQTPTWLNQQRNVTMTMTVAPNPATLPGQASVQAVVHVTYEGGKPDAGQWVDLHVSGGSFNQTGAFEGKVQLNSNGDAAAQVFPWPLNHPASPVITADMLGEEAIDLSPHHVGAQNLVYPQRFVTKSVVGTAHFVTPTPTPTPKPTPTPTPVATPTPTPIATPTPTPVATPTPTPVTTPTPTPVATPTPTPTPTTTPTPVGFTASVSTKANVATAIVGDTLSDTVTFTESEAQHGNITATLLGPVAPVNGACTDVDWTGAATAGTSTVGVTGSSTYTTSPVTVTAAGCYTWTEHGVIGTSSTKVTSPPGQAVETTVVSAKLTATVATLANVQTATAGASLQDTIAFTESGSDTGTLTATLLGPLPPVNGTCVGVNWTGAPVAGTSSVAVTSSGSYQTTAITVATAGCYTWTETGVLSPSGVAVTTTAGEATETTLVTPTGAVQGISTGPVPVGAVLGAVSTPSTGAAPSQGLLRSSLVGLMLILSGVAFITGLRRNPHANN